MNVIPRDGRGPRLLGVVALALVMAAAGEARVSAHAMPERATPAPGARLDHAPTVVRILFDEDLEGFECELRVEDAHRRVVSHGRARVDPSHPRWLAVGLEPLGPGVYHVRWVAVTRDRHRTEGDYTFTVSPP